MTDAIWYLFYFAFIVETAFVLGGVYSLLKWRFRKVLPRTKSRVLTDSTYLLYSGWMIDSFVCDVATHPDRSYGTLITMVAIQAFASAAIYWRVREYRKGKVFHI